MLAISFTRSSEISPKSVEIRSEVVQSGMEDISGPLMKNHSLCHPLLLEGLSIRERFSNLALGLGSCLLSILKPRSRDFPAEKMAKKESTVGGIPSS